MRSIHVAIIMDGNGRWARGRGHARFFGHVRGAERVRDVVEEACRLELGALTLYAFSTENWKRPEQERSVLWKLLRRYLGTEVPELRKKNIRLRVIGDRSHLSPDLRAAIESAECELASCTGLQLNLAISYGARDELVRAARKFAADCAGGTCTPDSLTEARFSAYLDTSALGSLADVDLVLRTSGEQRISNFLLWQLAYAELVFLEKSWPEFDGSDLRRAVHQLSGRQRRFGDVAAASATAHPPVEVTE